MIGFTGMSSRWEAPMLRTRTHTRHTAALATHTGSPDRLGELVREGEQQRERDVRLSCGEDGL